MNDNQKMEQIYFVPLYYYLAVPDFNKIHNAVQTSALKASYTIKLVDLQTNTSILEANNNFSSHLEALKIEHAFPMPQPESLLYNSSPYSRFIVGYIKSLKLSIKKNLIKIILLKKQGTKWLKSRLKPKRDFSLLFSRNAKGQITIRKKILTPPLQKIITFLKWVIRWVTFSLKLPIYLFLLLLRNITKLFVDNIVITIKNILRDILTLSDHSKLFHKIYHFLAEQKPACVIVNSDLGNINIRMTIASAKLLNIPVIIFWMGDIEKKKGSLTREWMNKFLIYLEHFVPYHTACLRAVFFNETFLNIFGYFAYDATILVSNTIAKQKLLDEGIKPNKIKIVTFKMNRVFDPKNLCESVKKRFIVFYTENLSSIYGEEYLICTHKALAELFAELHRQFNVQFIIRPHPMERRGDLYKKFILECFHGEGIIIDQGFSIEYLIENSLLNIAHFSKVLLDTLLTGKRIYSINILNDNRTFIPEGKYPSLEARSIDDIRKALQQFLSSNENFNRVFHEEHDKLRKWLLNSAQPFENAFQEIMTKKVI